MEKLYPIKGWEDYYITKSGAVYSSFNHTGEIKKLNPTKNNNGYLTLRVRKKIQLSNGVYKTIIRCVSVHRLVAEMFLTKPKKKTCVTHINGDRTDNRVKNLIWTSLSKTIERSYRVFGRIGFYKGKSGSQHPESKSVQQILDGKVINTFGSIKEAERKTGVAYTHISDVCNNKPKYKTAGGYQWKFVNIK